MTTPTVSVVMSVFNGERFLSESVESILAQTFADFEFLIINDGSTDKTTEILSSYTKLDSRVRVFAQQNRGRAESLNAGIELAAGRYIARIDADDVAMANRLQEQVDFLKRHPNVGLLGGACELINDSGQVLQQTRCLLDDSAIQSELLVGNPIWHPAVVMRKEVVVASGGYRKALLDADDYDLWLRMAERSQLANLPQIVLQYRIHSAQVSIQNMVHQTWCALAARGAASFRKRGRPDPLVDVVEITPQFLSAMGVTEAQIEQALAGVYADWIDILRRSDPELALQIIQKLLHLSRSESIGHLTAAETWLNAASIHRGQGRPVRALVSVGRGILESPIIARRVIKTAFMRVSAACKS